MHHLRVISEKLPVGVNICLFCFPRGQATTIRADLVTPCFLTGRGSPCARTLLGQSHCERFTGSGLFGKGQRNSYWYQWQTAVQGFKGCSVKDCLTFYMDLDLTPRMTARFNAIWRNIFEFLKHKDILPPGALGSLETQTYQYVFQNCFSFFIMTTFQKVLLSLLVLLVFRCKC